MDIEVRRFGEFTTAQASRIQDAIDAVNGLDTDKHLRMVDAGIAPFYYPSCSSRSHNGYNWNTVRWAGETDDNYAAQIRWNGIGDSEICNFNIYYYLDTNKWYEWHYGRTGTGEGQAHWLRIVLHEFGHSIGFGLNPASKSHFTDFANCPEDGTNYQEIMCTFWYGGKDYPTYRPSERGVFKHAYS